MLAIRRPLSDTGQYTGGASRTMVARADGVVYEVVDGQAVLVDAVGRELITLNPVGTLIWQALDGESDATSVAETLLPQLEGVTLDELVRDTEAFLRELLDLGLATEPAP